MADLATHIGAIDTGGRGSLYQRLARGLRSAIEQGLVKPEEALPAERDLAIDFSVSRITVRKALDSLVADGLLVRRHGAGTFVAGRVEKQFAKLSSFTEDMAARGRQVSSEWLMRAEGSVTPDESMMLGLGPGAPVLRFRRIRFADELPMAIEHSTIPAFAIDGLKAVGDSLYAALEQTGNRPTRALQRLRAVSFTADQAELIGIEAGAPGLFIERRGFLEDGRAVEATHSWYRGDAYDFVAELSTR
ncbi:GntR family transcriptional regulator [Sphingomonas sp. Mn802worker]|uniref:GntR family transcriptional regulator n=1 Tax=Sphingomonas sp. Mn802worker TaxID=629773 RepID=UPI0003776959|nr:GntR family transcriptional regulator [Sphingomonas sp. Mn802worker]